MRVSSAAAVVAIGKLCFIDVCMPARLQELIRFGALSEATINTLWKKVAHDKQHYEKQRKVDHQKSPTTAVNPNIMSSAVIYYKNNTTSMMIDC
eukprot:scaffold117618_cov35-Prasinocladus_malaysianus.AAC.5